MVFIITTSSRGFDVTSCLSYSHHNFVGQTCAFELWTKINPSLTCLRVCAFCLSNAEGNCIVSYTDGVNINLQMQMASKETRLRFLICTDNSMVFLSSLYFSLISTDISSHIPQSLPGLSVRKRNNEKRGDSSLNNWAFVRPSNILVQKHCAKIQMVHVTDHLLNDKGQRGK